MLQTETRKLAAIMFTDMVGFSRQMGTDEARMLRLLHVHDRIIQQAVTEHHGTIIKTGGDSFLVDFPSVVHAVQCAQRLQAQFRAHNAEKETNEQIHACIGIHLGDTCHGMARCSGTGSTSLRGCRSWLSLTLSAFPRRSMRRSRRNSRWARWCHWGG